MFDRCITYRKQGARVYFAPSLGSIIGVIFRLFLVDIFVLI